MTIFVLMTYSKSTDVTILFFAAAFLLLIAFGVPPLIVFFKAAALKGMDQEKAISGD